MAPPACGALWLVLACCRLLLAVLAPQMLAQLELVHDLVDRWTRLRVRVQHLSDGLTIRFLLDLRKTKAQIQARKTQACKTKACRVYGLS